MSSNDPAFTFVDLFAGIGGFAAALKAFGGASVYSVEIDRVAAKVYEQNWGHSPLGDITVDANDTAMNVPEHHILTAGFPCQPFSKSGAQRGMDETRGTLFWNILKIIEAHHPPVVVLENVRNLAGPRHRHEWQVIIEQLRAQGYHVADEPAVFSPHLLPRQRGGRPHVRERVFITATHDPDGLGEVDPLPAVRNESLRGGEEWDLEVDLPLEPDHQAECCELSDEEIRWIDAWDDWVRMMWRLRREEAGRTSEPMRRLPGFPVWSDAWVHVDALEILDGTPSWKENFLRKNADLYTAHASDFDAWRDRHGVRDFPASRRKFEWQAQSAQTLWECVMQMRPSGIRAKRATHLPALVAITQTSIIGPRRRRLSPREAARLQGLPDNFLFDGQRAASTYRQLGNGVNVGVVWHVLREHVRRDEPILKRTAAGRRVIDAVLAPEVLGPDHALERVVEESQRRAG
ncbi:DNA cytosine methyltransferase [Mumia zhuanghuii]|uniref:DNA (cytosine-5-)-methyltransferase n=2 Tax=Mumia TaxID=1546255 RepID=A0ABW1QP45_9ACTN|nr:MULTISPECIES: DNA cytosine methyltransferase [Mumia]KAA1420687.1 DNA cytosine methyltransferase [Mumia zhuanghuii]